MSDPVVKPWWLYLLEVAMSALTKRNLEAAGAGPEAMAGAATGSLIGLPTLYSVEEERMKNVERLKGLCDEAVSNPAFQPRGGKTYCNFAARFIAEGMGFFGLPQNTLANDLIAIMAAHPDCREDSVERAHAHAMRGGLAFLALVDDPHGHIPVIYPAPMERSGTWGEDVPLLANVGAKNGVMKASAVYRLGMKPFLRAFLVGETA